MEAADARPVKGRSKVCIVINLASSAVPAAREAGPTVPRTPGALPRLNQACRWRRVVVWKRVAEATA